MEHNAVCIFSKKGWSLTVFDHYQKDLADSQILYISYFLCRTSKCTFSYFGDFQNQLFIHLVVVIRYADLRFNENGLIHME